MSSRATRSRSGPTVSPTARSISVSGAATIPTTWFQAFNPFMIFAFTPFVVALWRRQAQRGKEPSTVVKLALGCLALALANAIMAIAAWRIGDSGQTSWLWLFAYFVVITVGELYLSPTGLSFVTKTAPASMVSLMMGVWLATELSRQLPRRLARQLLEQRGESGFLPDDRRDRRARRNPRLRRQPDADRAQVISGRRGF